MSLSRNELLARVLRLQTERENLAYILSSAALQASDAERLKARLLTVQVELINRKRNSPPIVIPPYHCPHCGYDMPVNELLRKDFSEVICSKCGKAFSG